MTKFNPFAREIKYAQSVNKAVTYKNLYVYRTVDGKVQKFDIRIMHVDLYTGTLSIEYQKSESVSDIVVERASELDLKMISQQAQQYAKAAR